MFQAFVQCKMAVIMLCTKSRGTQSEVKNFKATVATYVFIVTPVIHKCHSQEKQLCQNLSLVISV